MTQRMKVNSKMKTTLSKKASNIKTIAKKKSTLKILAEPLSQIAHYFAEHLILTNDIKIIDWMNHAILGHLKEILHMHVCRYVGMRLRNHDSIKEVNNYASGQMLGNSLRLQYI